MVGLALRLRLTLLRNNLQRGPGANARQTAFGLSIVGGCGLAAMSLLLVGITRGRDPLADDVATLLYTLLLAGWVVLPVLTFAGDDLLDPSRLALLPLTRRDRMTILAVAGVVGVPAAATLLSALSLVIATAYAGATSYVVALVAAGLEMALCVVVSRVVAAGLSGLLRSRRGRDIGVALTLLVAMSLQLLNLVMQRLAPARRGISGLHHLAAALDWTPPALLARAPSLAREGRLDAAVGSLLLVAAVILALVVIWERLVSRALERVDASGARRRRRTRLSPVLLSPLAIATTRIGAIAAKDLRYLVRDPRRLVSQLIGVLMPALFIVLGPLGRGRGTPEWSVFVVCLVALFSGLAGANRFGQDGTATWMLLASHVDRRDPRRDLLGGDVATVVVVAPLLVATGLVVSWLGAGNRYLPAAMGTAAALLLVCVAASAIPAVIAPYTVPDNNRNAFAGANVGQGCFASIVAMACMGGCAIVCLPLLALLLPSLHSPGWGWLLLVVGPVYGLVVGHVIRQVAARRWQRRGPEILQLLVSTQP